MKHNYKFRIDEPVPSDEQIDRHRNFDQLLADHRNMTEPLYRRPLYRNPRAFLGLFLILVIGFLVFQAVEEEEQASDMASMVEEVNKHKQDQFLQPAGTGFEVPTETFEIEPGEEAIHTLPSGAVVRIPEHAFPSSDNPVQISIREFTEPLAAVLSGVPLDLGDDGQVIPSRIFQISTTSAGHPIDLASNSEITIEMTGPRNPETAQDVLYVLDMNDKIWKNGAEKVNMEERSIDSPHSPVIINNDGFDAIEYEDDGSIRRQPIAPGEDNPTGTIQWVRSFESTGNGFFMCGTPAVSTPGDISVRLIDDQGQRVKVFALYQASRDGKTIRTYWPQDSKFTYEIASSTPGSKLFGFTESGKVAWIESPGGSEEVIELKPTISTQEVQDLQSLKAILAIESE